MGLKDRVVIIGLKISAKYGGDVVRDTISSAIKDAFDEQKRSIGVYSTEWEKPFLKAIKTSRARLEMYETMRRAWHDDTGLDKEPTRAIGLRWQKGAVEHDLAHFWKEAERIKKQD